MAITRAILRHLRGKNFITLGPSEYAHKIAGLSQVFLEPAQRQSLSEALQTFEASAAASPFILACRIAGELHYDGGYISPISVLPGERVGGNFQSDLNLNPDPDEASTALTLLTRQFETKPMLFSYYGKHFIQPSRKIPVSTFYVRGNCTADTRVDDAFALGQNDARHFVEEKW